MKFIWISGSINSGKSTIAAELNRRIRKSVNIELDELRHFAHYEKLEDIGDYIITDALDLAKKWSDRGFLPILTWPLWGEGLLHMISYSEKLGIKPVLINLIPEKDIAKKNRGKRELTEWEFNRIEYMYETENIQNPAMGFLIDNTNQNVSETTEEIIKIIKDMAEPYL